MGNIHPPENTPPAARAMISQDIFVEVSHGPTLIDNNIMLSKASVRFSAQGVACVHNLILGSFTAVGGGTDINVNGVNQPRYTPYHIPHRTLVDTEHEVFVKLEQKDGAYTLKTNVYDYLHSFRDEDIGDAQQVQWIRRRSGACAV